GESYAGSFNAVPANEPWTEGHDELVALLCPLSPDAYEKWRAEREPSKKGRASKSSRGGRGRKAAALPSDLFEALHAETTDLQAAGWSMPPGGAFVAYRRKADAFTLQHRRNA